MKIQFDETDMPAGAAHGISRSFSKQSEANVQGLSHLPFQTETINEVRAYADSVRGFCNTVCLVGIGGRALAFDREGVELGKGAAAQASPPA